MKSNHTFRSALCLILCSIVLFTPAVFAEVPQLINYQGRVAVSGVNFEGAGLFKFALVSAGVDVTEQAAATAVETSGFITSINVVDGGAGYIMVPAVSISGGGSGAAAHAVISGGVVTSIVVDNPGFGYTSVASVIIDSPTAELSYSTYWSNDGTSTAGNEPAAAVSLVVTKGLYSVLLGDATLSNMLIVPPSVFTNGTVYLRVWFNDGSNGSQLLTPDQRIAAVGYAMMAGEALTVPDGAITSSKLAAGAVDSIHLATGAAAANLADSGQSGVASGGILLSEMENMALVNAGYVLIGPTMLGGAWQESETAGAPAARRSHTAVWTGSEMIVWGGWNGSSSVNDGARYNPTANSWTTVQTAGAPTARYLHSAVWTGSEMIVWGGLNGSSSLNDGGRYNPALNSWEAVPTIGAPADAPTARTGHSAVWTGSEMIVWGGVDGSSLNDGGLYNPTANSWTTVQTAGAPGARRSHTAVWTGSEMIIWGGGDEFSSLFNDGGRYNPTANSWTTVQTAGAPAPRSSHTAVWTGSEMIVWGGNTLFSTFNDGGRYNPTANSWTAVQTAGAPSARRSHTAVWTGSEMIVWGGAEAGFHFNDGSRYNPAANSWTAMPTAGAPTARYIHSAVWTGSEMIVWGGLNTSVLNDGGRFSPERIMFLYQRP